MEEWRSLLASGDSQAAWDAFIARYRKLILATIRRTVMESADVVEVFSAICGDLSSDELQALTRYDGLHAARFSTWLVTLVHNRAVDWMRKEYGRRRVTIPRGLSHTQQQIFRLLFVERRAHVEAYEIMRQTGETSLPYRAFLKEVTATYRALERNIGKPVTHYLPGPPLMLSVTDDSVEVSLESESGLATALQRLNADERLAVQLFVVDELPAEKVASIVGWPNAKAVYNRVNRALARVRQELERRGLNRINA